MLPIPLFFFLYLSEISSEDLPTPSSLLTPRNFNHHPHQVKQYLKEIKQPEPTKQGPVLFPYTAAPAPRLPLVVTSRPLSESIARSDLNLNYNNSIAEQSQLNHVAFKPNYQSFDQYQPITYEYTEVPIPDYEGAKVLPDRIPYANVLKARGSNAPNNRYNEYEERTSLPPIYKALSDYAQNKLLKTKQKPISYDYKTNDPDYGTSYENNELPVGNEDTEYNQGENYAFSYSVKDRKTGDDFSHRQHSTGSATNGEYRVRLPDGRTQIVSYTADENGYKADVRYDDDDVGKNHIETKQNDYKDTGYRHSDKNNQFKDYNNEHNVRDNPVVDYNYNSQFAKDYTQRDFNVKPVKEDYYNQYPDTSKEYYNDYSLEYPSKYDTDKSKFNTFKTLPTPNYSTTVRPSYEEIKDLFTNQPPLNNPNYISDRAIEINAPSTPNYDGVTENVVVIAPKLYTHVRSSTPYPDVVTPKAFVVTPATYLASTIATLKDRIKAAKPILSQSFINRINKYLTFT